MQKLILVWSACLILALLGCGEKAVTPHHNDGSSIDPIAIPDNVQKLIGPYILPDGDIPEEVRLDYLDPTNADFTDYDVFSITFLWGDIFGNGSPSFAITDWSGTLAAGDNGMVRVHYVIDFEPGQDSIIPVATPTTAAWVSTTLQDFDGINFIVYMRRINPSNVPASIVFETEPFTLRLFYNQLFNLSAFYQIDETKGVAIHSRLIWQNTCPGGTMDGFWIKESAENGTFMGYWRDHNGEAVGYMNGTFWTDENGKREFLGSVSGLYADVVIAELAGTWNYDDYRLCPMCGDDHGYFRGKFNYLTENRHGYLKGVFGDWSLPPDRDSLPYIGVWRNNCPWVTPNNADADIR